MMHSSFTFREFRTQTVMFTKAPLFYDCKHSFIPTYQHHVSLYALQKEEAKKQILIGNTKNREVVHYSAELVIDTDNEETAKNVWEELHKLDYEFELWKLNNYKFFLKRDEIDTPSELMCYQDRQFVRENFLHLNEGVNGLDLAIFNSPFHLCRAKGAVHEKTKAKSIKIADVKGQKRVSTNSIELSNLTQPQSYDYQVNFSDWEQLQYAINSATIYGPSSHHRVFFLAQKLKNSLSYDTALELCLIYAKSMEFTEEKALRAFQQGYNSK